MVCLVFFAPLLAVACVMAWAGGGPVLIGRRVARPDGSSFTAWRFNVRGRTADAAPGTAGGAGFGRFGRFLYRTRLEVMPHFVNVARGDMALGELFREI